VSVVNIGIVSKPDHCKAHAKGLEMDGHVVVLAGAGGERLTDTLDAIVCRIASCSHHGSKVAREWAKRTGRPLIIEDGLAGIRRRLVEIQAGEMLDAACATALTRAYTRSPTDLVVPNVEILRNEPRTFTPEEREALIAQAHAWTGTQRAFAVAHGVSQPTVSKWMNTSVKSVKTRTPEPSPPEPSPPEAPCHAPVDPTPEPVEPPMSDIPLPRRSIDQHAIPTWIPDAMGEHLLEVMSYLSETGITELTLTCTGFRWKRVTVSEGEVKL
jgi:transposase-like protein